MKKALALLLALVMVFSLVACSKTADDTPDDTTTDAPVTTDKIDEGNVNIDASDVEEVKTDYVHPIVHMVEKNDFLTLDPFERSAPTATYELYEYLYAYPAYDGDAEPVLADKTKGNYLGGGCDHEAGTGVYVIYLYDYIVDHMGNNITAADVVFSYNHYLESNKINGTGYRKMISYEATDTYEVTFTFSEELTGLRELETVLIASPIISEKSFNELDGNLTTSECGTGPYVLKSFVSGSETVLEAYDNYWQTNDDLKSIRQLANVQEINYAYLPDASQQIIAMQSGEIDLIQDASADFVDMFREGGQYDEGFNVISYLQSGCLRVSLNHAEGHATSRRTLRQAIFYAIDNEGFVQAMGGDKYGVVTPTVWGVGQPDFQESWYDLENFNTVYSLDESKAWADKAGYNGEALVLLASTSVKTEAELLAEMLKSAGFNIDLQVVDESTQKTRSDNGEWDIQLGNAAGYCGAMMIMNNFSYKYELADGTQVGSAFENAPEWLDLADTLASIEGHTAENAQAWVEGNVDGAHHMGLCTTWINLIVNDSITAVCRTDKNKLIPGSFTYVES